MLKHLDLPLVRDKVRELYTIVFQFLTDIFTEWYASKGKRFMKSFDRNSLSKLFQPHKDKLAQLTSKLDDVIRDYEHAKTQKDISQLKQLFEGNSKEVKDMLYRLGRNLQVQFEEYVVDAERYQRRMIAEPSSAQHLLSSADREDVESIVGETLWTFEQHEILSKILDLDERKQRHDELQRLLERAAHLQVDRKVTKALREWMFDSKAATHWIEGPAAVSTPSQNTLTSAALTALLQQRHCVAFYFCNSQKTRSHKQALREMIKSLIVQLVSSLPPRVSTAVDLSPERFELAMRTNTDTALSLSLMSDLQNLVTRSVLCVIDGLQVLENRSDRDHTRNLNDFSKLICEATLNSQSPSKLCFFTDGYVDALARVVESHSLRAVRFEVESDEWMADDTVLFSVAEGTFPND